MAVNMPVVTMLSTEDVPPGQRVKSWERQSEASLMSFSCSVDSGQPFMARQIHLALPRMRFMKMNGSGHSIGRSAAGIRAKPADVLFLCLLTGGEAVFAHGKDAEVLCRGDAILYDPDRPFTYSFAHELNQVVVEIPRPLFGAISGQDGLLVPRVISREDSYATDGRGRLISLVQRSIDEPTTAVVREEEALAIIGDMVLRIRRAPDESHVDAANRFVVENLLNPRLSVARIAGGLGITPRQLNRLFAAEGKSIGTCVLHARLERAHALLLDPDRSGLGISAIAVLAGFSSPAHFARTFRARYGATASEVRRAEGQ